MTQSESSTRVTDQVSEIRSTYLADEVSPLSPDQQRWWSLRGLNDDQNQIVGVSACFELRGDAAVPAALRRTLREVVSNESCFRLRFVERGGVPFAFTTPVGTMDVAVENCDSFAQDVFTRWSEAGEVGHFDLEFGPLLRVRILHVADRGSSFVMLTAHPLVADARTLELVAVALSRQQHSKPDPDRSIITVARDERAQWKSTAVQDDAASWSRWLLAPAARELRSPYERPAVKQRQCARVSCEVERDDCLQFSVATEAGDSLFVALWLVLLARCNASDFSVCSVPYVAPEDAAVLGPLTTSRPIRAEVAYETLLGTVRDEVASQLDTESRHPSYARVLQVADVKRDTSRAAIAQTTARVVDDRLLFAPEDGIRRVAGRAWNPDNDLAMTLFLDAETARLELTYDTSIYDEDVATMYLTTFHDLVARASKSAGGRVRAYTLSAKSPDASALAAPGGSIETTGTVIGSAVQKMMTTPEAIAVITGDRRAVSYDELARSVQSAISDLTDREVGVHSRVASLTVDNFESLVFLLAASALGATFVGLDPASPRGRLAELLDQIQPHCLVAPARSHAELPESMNQVLLASAVRVADQSRWLTNWEPISPETTAYMIFTSGTSGPPKAVHVTHRSLWNNIQWRQKQWVLSASEGVLHNFKFHFDPSMWAAWWPLCAGAHIVLARESDLLDARAVQTLLVDRGVSVIGGVPSWLNVAADLCAGQGGRLRLIFSGGESLSPSLASKLQSVFGAHVVNMYGPTETTVDVCYQSGVPDVAPRRLSDLPIGTAIDNCFISVVDDDCYEVLPGVPGQLAISGLGVAGGYFRRPVDTAAKFIPDCVPGRRGARAYCSGDLGVRFGDGVLHFIGRTDQQVKVRGYRIELSEVESAVGSVEGVTDVAVVKLGEAGQDAYLGCAVVSSGSLTTSQDIKEQLSRKLPTFMVPSVIAVVNEIPRNSSGKVDITAVGLQLRSTEMAQGDDREVSRVEARVLDLFSVALARENLTVDDDLFNAGGTSLLVARLASQIESQFGVSLALHDLFRVPTAAGVAALIEEQLSGTNMSYLLASHAQRLQDDAELPASVHPGRLPRADWVNASEVLLTGATGYLGLHILAALLRDTEAIVHVLVRAKDEVGAYRRLQNGWDEYRLPDQIDVNRVRIHLGDLGRPQLGLDDTTWQALAVTLDAIYHNGAFVNFVYPYSALKPANVDSTVWILKLATTARVKAVHYVSTIDTLLSTHLARPFTEDDRTLNSAINVPAGYTGSKWVAENIVNLARRREIPVTIFRPGLILGHASTGATQAIDYLLVALKGFLPKGIVPDYPRIFDAVPVDYVADGIVAISRMSEAAGKFFHMFNPAPVSLKQFTEWVSDYGYEFQVVPFEVAREQALAVGPDDPLYPLQPLMRDAEAAPHRALDPQFMNEVQPGLECANTVGLLGRTGIVCPPMSRELAFRMLDFLVSTQFLPQPSGGAKELLSHG